MANAAFMMINATAMIITSNMRSRSVSVAFANLSREVDGAKKQTTVNLSSTVSKYMNTLYERKYKLLL